ncbi:MAG: hypothetical protein INQ03_23590 [Candidatus Heimdallarchaeota archaeon]|nr:hypothetical protein [Candidatus Heimdallarchaeota archaeon]
MTSPIHFDEILSTIRDVVGMNISGNLENWFLQYQNEVTDVFNLPESVKHEKWKFDFIFITRNEIIQTLLFSPKLFNTEYNFVAQMDVIFHGGIPKETSLAIVQKFVKDFTKMFPFCTIRAHYTEVSMENTIQTMPEALMNTGRNVNNKLLLLRKNQ